MVDVDYAFNYFSKIRSRAIPLFIEFMNADNEDQCLDDVEKIKLSDDEVREHVRKLGISNPTMLQQMDKDERDDVLRKLRETEGTTLYQIARVTGISKSVIGRA